MNILISVNESYFDKAETMLFSLRRNTHEAIEVFMVNHSLNAEYIDSFDEFLKRNKMKLHIVDVNSSVFDNMTLGDSHFSIEMYYRIIAQFILPKDLERILWLDADIIINKDLKDFYFQDFDNNALIACPDAKHNSEMVSAIKKKIGLSKEHIYFNSGVLLLNLSYLRDNTNMENIISISNELNDRLTYPDQDILNYLYSGKIKYCDWEKYNFQIIEMECANKKMLKKAVVLHYTGPRKPWSFRDANSLSKYYWKYEILRGKAWQVILCYIKSKLYIIKVKLRDLHIIK